MKEEQNNASISEYRQKIELSIGDKKAFYHSVSRVVTFCTKNGVILECELPIEWDLVRIFTFMESLIKADEVLN